MKLQRYAVLSGALMQVDDGGLYLRKDVRRKIKQFKNMLEPEYKNITYTKSMIIKMIDEVFEEIDEAFSDVISKEEGKE